MTKVDLLFDGLAELIGMTPKEMRAQFERDCPDIAASLKDEQISDADYHAGRQKIREEGPAFLAWLGQQDFSKLPPFGKA